MTMPANHCTGGAPSSFPDSLLARGGARVSGGTARRFSAVGGEARRFRHLLPDRRARLHRGRRQAGAGRPGAVLDGVALGTLCARIFDATGEGILRGGRAIDCSHAVAEARGVFRRFRCNLAPVQAAGGFAVNITLRVLPGAPPSFEELGIEDEIVEAWDLRRGLTLVTGVPGSGKSTLLAAGTRRLLGARRRAHPVV